MIIHLACVMDGNRRWAKQQGKLAWIGHRAGVKTVETVIKFCLKYKISYLSLYTFSLENFKRSEKEQSYLFDIIVQQAEKYIHQFVQEGIKIKFIGDLSLFPQTVQNVCHKVEDQTSTGSLLQVNFLFGYGARQEIFSAAQKLAQQIITGNLITQENFESYLWTKDIPDPDLIIRTGGVQRLSNFLLYQAAYAEIRFIDTLWPDLREEEILTSVLSAIEVKKNVGK